MKKTVYLIFLVCLAFVMKSCFGVKNPPQIHQPPLSCWAYILSPQDTVKVNYYGVEKKKRFDVIYPSPYPQEFVWLPFPDQEGYPTETTDIQAFKVQKLSNNSEIVVIECVSFYINDELYSFQSYFDPADSISILDFNGKPDTVIMHRKYSPYDLKEVIDEIERQYPDYVHRITDSDIHKLNNWEAFLSENIPRIYLDKE